MKKIIGLLVGIVLCASSSFAEISFGIRGGAGISMLDLSDDFEDSLKASLASTGLPWNLTNDNVASGGFSIFGRYNFEKVPGLGLQFEFGMLFNNGTEITIDGSYNGVSYKITDKVSYTSVELPFLVTYTVNKGGFFEFTPQLGLYLSIPVGGWKNEMDYEVKYAGKTLASGSSDSDGKMNGVNVGFAGGVEFAFNFTDKSAAVLNIRYIHDFTQTKDDESDIDCFQRKSVLFSAGYRHTIGRLGK